jgi:3alpha(or 20beta)-hydroxysteroid dehydrogenase
MPILPSDEKQWAEALVTGSTRPERLDVIVNLCNPERVGAHGRIDHAEFRRILDRNYTRTFLVLKYGTRALGASGGGTIINVTSNAAMTGAANSAARCAAAHGIALMTRSAALSGAAAFVRVNALLAGDVAASGATTLDAGQTSPEVVAAAVAFLAADASKYFTGLLMPVDNGGAAR